MSSKDQAEDDNRQPSQDAPPTVKAHEGPNTKEAHAHNKPPNSKKPWRRDQKIQLAIFFAAIGVGIVALMQWGLTRQELHDGQRAYLSIGRGLLVAPPTAGQEVRPRLELTNTGQTPAHTIVAIGAVLVAAAPPRRVNYTFTKPFGINLGAGQTRVLESFNTTYRPTADEMKRIVAGTRKLLVMGAIRYADVFGERNNVTEFCLFYQPGQSDLAFCDTHNEIR